MKVANNRMKCRDLSWSSGEQFSWRPAGFSPKRMIFLGYYHEPKFLSWLLLWHCQSNEECIVCQEINICWMRRKWKRCFAEVDLNLCYLIWMCSDIRDSTNKICSTGFPSQLKVLTIRLSGKFIQFSWKRKIAPVCVEIESRAWSF